VAVRITADQITSDDSPHTAVRRRYEAGDAWQVSWLPGRLMDQAAARNAIKLADTAAVRDFLVESLDVEALIEAEAADLGMAGADAVARISKTGAVLAAADEAMREAAPEPEAGQ
jgi:hypothetical protein